MLAPSPRKMSDEWNASHIGRLYEKGKITKAEFEAAKVWREVYRDYLASIGVPGYTKDLDGLGHQINASDLRCEELKKRVYRGIEEVKKNVGRRGLHALNALVVYEEPEELGDFDYTVQAAKVAMSYLAKIGI